MLLSRILPLLIFISCTLRLQAQDYFQNLYSFKQSALQGLDLKTLPDGKIVLLSSSLLRTDTMIQSNLTLMDSHGALIWSKILKMGSFNNNFCLALATDGNAVVGLNGLDTSGAPVSAVLKVSIASGEILWQSFFLLPSAVTGPSHTLLSTPILRIVPLIDHGYAVLASTGYGPWLGVERTTIVFKLNEDGNLLWEKTWTNGQALECFDLAENSLGELYCCGINPKFDYNNRGIVIKLAPDGSFMWARSYNGSFTHLRIDAADHLCLGGFGPDSYSSIHLQKMREDGSVIWSKLLTPDPLQKLLELTDLSCAANGDLLICANDPAHGKNACVLARVGSAGTLLWASKYHPSFQSAYFTALGTSAAGDIMAGGFAGELNRDLSLWLIKTDPSGHIPGCCSAGFAFGIQDILPLSAPVDLSATSSLQQVTGTASLDFFSPDIIALCMAQAGSASPNAFTPNEDQINDYFLPAFNCPPETLRFAVFNRWGNKVFETSEPGTLGWDGRADNQTAPADVYGWLLEYTTVIDGNPETKREKGEVTLLR